MGMLSSNNPSIYSPIFILKKSFNLKSSKTKPTFSRDIAHAKQKPSVIFRAPEYWFKKNRKLSVMNFKPDDMLTLFSEIQT